MNKYFLSLAALLISFSASAYVSLQGNDPNLGTYDVEYKSAVKSTVALYSDALSKGHAVYYYDLDLTGMSTVSRYSAQTANAAGAVPYQAGIVGRAVATGDIAAFPLITRGYVDYAYYDATSPITVGGYLCIGTAASVKGVLIGCAANVTSHFISLETKASGSGSNLKVRVNSN